MVVLNQPIIQAELDRRGWSETRLAAEMDVAPNTVRNMLDGKGLRHDTQVSLFNAFGGLIPFGELFQVVPGPDVEQATADHREEKVA